MIVSSRWILVAAVAALLGACNLPASQHSSAEPEAEFSMAVYPLVLLKAGDARGEVLSEEEGARLQAAHLAHIGSMADAGHLLLAGPMMDRPGDDPIIGILLFRPGHEAAAQELPAHDPLVKAGRLRTVFLRWYGPAGLTYVGDPGPLEGSTGG